MMLMMLNDESLIKYCQAMKRQLTTEHWEAKPQWDQFYTAIHLAAKSLNLHVYTKPNGMIINHSIELTYEFGEVVVTRCQTGNLQPPYKIPLTDKSLTDIGNEMVKMALRMEL